MRATTLQSRAMTEHAVVIAGGGPTGLMLAGELALAGVDVAIVERRASQELAGSRAGGLHSRTIEVLDQRGIADRFLSRGAGGAGRGVRRDPRWTSATFPPGTTTGSGSGRTTSSASWPAGSASWRCRSIAAREVTGFAQDDTGVDVELSDGQSLRAEYLVGCDGGRSLIRKAAGIEFPGWDPTTSNLIAEVEMAEEPELGIRRDALGIHALGRWSTRSATARWSTDRAGAGHGDRTARRTHERAHPARSQRGAHRRLRDRLRDPQSHLDLPVHRHDPAGRGLPRRTGPAGRRRRARAFPGRWTGPQHRCAGCGESGMEAGPGGQRDVAGEPPRHLPRRAPPGRCPRAAQHDGAGRAPPPGRPHEGPARHHVRAARAWTSRASGSPR